MQWSSGKHAGLPMEKSEVHISERAELRFLLQLGLLAKSAMKVHLPYTVGEKMRRQEKGLAARLHVPRLRIVIC